MTHARKTYIRFILHMLAVLAITVVVGFNALLLWVAAAPRSLGALTPYIERAFSGDGSQFKVSIAETWLIWDGWKHPIDIRLHDVAVLTPENRVFSRFPEIAVGVHIPSLLIGKILPTSLGIAKPVISLLQNEDGTIQFGFQTPADKEPAPGAEAQPTVPFAMLVTPFLTTNSSNNLRKLSRIRITDADVSIGNMRKGVFFEARDAELLAKRNRKGVIEVTSRAKVRYGDYQSPIDSRFIIDAAKQAIDGNVEFKGVELNTLARLFTRYEDLSSITTPISGNTQLSMDMNGLVKQVHFAFEGGYGRIESPHLAAPMAIDWLRAEGTVTNNAQDVQIDALTGQVEGMPVSASALISMSADDVAVKGALGVKDVTVAKLPMLWPPELAPLTREWITANITEGSVPEATAKINIAFGDLKKPVLPKEAVDASITLKDGKIRYLPEHPEVQKVQALIHVDGLSLNAAIDSATFLKDTKISNGTLVIDDLNLDNPYLKIGLDADTSAKDAVHFLGLPRLKHAERLGLKEAEIEGGVKGSAKLGFYFFAPVDAHGKPTAEGDIAYDVSAELTGISQPGFMKKFDIAQAAGAVTINNASLVFAGKGTVNGASASEANVTYLFHPDKGFDTFIDVKAAAPVESLPRFGYPKFDFLKGSLGVNAKLKLGESHELSEAAIDLGATEINAASIGWTKPGGVPANLAITAEKKEGRTAITAFSLKGNGLDAAGSATLNPAMTDIAGLRLNRLELGRTKLNLLNYAAIEGGYAVEAEGAALDLSGYMETRAQKKETDFSFEHFPALQLKTNIARVMVAAGQEIRDLKSEVDCNVRQCNSASVNGKIGDKPFDLRILKNPKGKRQISLHAQNAGAFLKATDIYDRMEGGDLSITGTFDDTPTDSILRARLDVSDHLIKKAPVLTKILSLASLTGFIDTLEGNGIRFNKMMANFTLAGDVIRIERAKAYGPAIGLTAEGSVTMPKGVCDIKGTVVPAYTLNSVIGKVPIIGQILTGGEGKGVFAANYSVKKTLDDPDVSVNPLSILTPGFLRGIFE